MFFRLLLESFRRQRRRKLLAGVAILLGATAVTAMLALATTIGDRIHAELAVFGANIVVTPKAAALDVNIGGTDIHPAGNAYLHASDLPKLRNIFWTNNITGVSPVLSLAQPVKATAAGTHPLAVHVDGVWFHHDLDGLITGAPKLRPWWKVDGSWPATPKEDAAVPVLVGANVAQQLGVHKGETLSISPASGTPARVAVSGILQSGDATENEIVAPLEAAQHWNGTPDAVSRVEVAAITMPEDNFARRNPDAMSPRDREIWYCRAYANSIAYQIAEAIPGSDAQQVRRVEQSEGVVLSRISGLMWLICAAALLAAGFAVSAAMATAILERRAEIGLMRSLGAAKFSIAMLFYAETALLAVFAGTLGYFFGSGLAGWLGARIFSTSAQVHIASAFNLVLLPIILGLALLVAIGGSTPSIRAALRLDPSAVLRSDG